MAEMTQTKKLGRPRMNEPIPEYKPIPLPALHSKVIIEPRDRNRNSAIVTYTGEVIDDSGNFIVLLLDNIKRRTAFTKAEIHTGIYKYEYIN